MKTKLKQKIDWGKGLFCILDVIQRISTTELCFLFNYCQITQL